MYFMKNEIILISNLKTNKHINIYKLQNDDFSKVF